MSHWYWYVSKNNGTMVLLYKMFKSSFLYYIKWDETIYHLKYDEGILMFLIYSHLYPQKFKNRITIHSYYHHSISYKPFGSQCKNVESVWHMCFTSHTFSLQRIKVDSRWLTTRNRVKETKLSRSSAVERDQSFFILLFRSVCGRVKRRVNAGQ